MRRRKGGFRVTEGWLSAPGESSEEQSVREGAVGMGEEERVRGGVTMATREVASGGVITLPAEVSASRAST